MASKNHKEAVLNTFQKMVLKNGLKETKLDDVSNALGISKKTIYKYYQSKDELVVGVIDRLVSDITKIIDDSLEVSTAPVEKYIELFTGVEQYLMSIDQKFMRDIQEYFPDLFSRMNEIRAEKLLVFNKIINDGIEKGDFKRINSKTATQMMISSITAILNPAYLNQNSIKIDEAIADLKTIFLFGIINN